MAFMYDAACGKVVFGATHGKKPSIGCWTNFFVTLSLLR
jgi:hypothetical protein